MQLNDIKRVVISVTDKKGIHEFARELTAFGAEILSTGGTAAQLRKSGVPVTEVSDYTGFPEMMDGRVKTLHPKIHGGLLALRDNDAHMRALREHGISTIECGDQPLPLRGHDRQGRVHPGACHRKHRHRRSVDAAGRFEELPLRIRGNRSGRLSEDHRGDEADRGKISEPTNFELAKKTFRLTAHYDGAISNYLAKVSIRS